MKKILIALVGASMIIGSASADIAVNFINEGGNNGGFWVDDSSATTGAGGYLDVGAKVSLIWAATDLSGAGGVGLNGLATGEFELVTTTCNQDSGRFLQISSSYTDADVGGANINSGFLYARVFQTGTLAQGDRYLDLDIASPTLATAPVPLPPGGGIQMGITGTYDVNTSTLQVVPEPATFGLIGVAAVGLLLARRKAQR